ncbi:MAG: hypothetical protein NTY53_05460 [Kiritimatiellaeota bacterium]|nr:hypothetical protein [Kiritimatiellota bacterium]
MFQELWKNPVEIFQSLEKNPRAFPRFGKTGGSGFQPSFARRAALGCQSLEKTRRQLQHPLSKRTVRHSFKGAAHEKVDLVR